MAVLRHLEAMRRRLYSSPEFVAFVPASQIYLSHIYDVIEPVYPCTTLRDVDVRTSTRIPSCIDPGIVEVEFHNQHSVTRGYEIEDWAFKNLHEHKNLVSTEQCCFIEIKRVFGPVHRFVKGEGTWVVTTRYQIRARNLT